MWWYKPWEWGQHSFLWEDEIIAQNSWGGHLVPEAEEEFRRKVGREHFALSHFESCDQMLQSLLLPEPPSRGVPCCPQLWPPKDRLPRLCLHWGRQGWGHLPLMVLCAPFQHLTREKAQISQSLPCLLPTSVNRCGIKKIKAKDLHSQFNIITGIFLIE